MWFTRKFTRKLRVIEVFWPKSKFTCSNLRENTEYRVLQLGTGLSLYYHSVNKLSMYRIRKLLLYQPLAILPDDFILACGKSVSSTSAASSRVTSKDANQCPNAPGHYIRTRISRTVDWREAHFEHKLNTLDLSCETHIVQISLQTHTRDRWEAEYSYSSFLQFISSSLQ